jgi:lipoate-protein ligase A
MVWRVVDLEADIYTMHAAEDYFLERVGKGYTPTVILSRLIRPAVSIGKGQNLRKDVNLEEAARLRVDVARRETGGRSVYLDRNHYLVSIIDRHATGSRDPGKTYADQCGQVLRVLSELTGVRFELRYVNDLVTSPGKKVGGAAQKNTASASLVHCYLRLATDFDTMLRLIKIDDVPLVEYQSEFEAFASSLEDETRMTIETFFPQFRAAFLSSLGEVAPTSLTQSERRSIDEIVRRQYKSSEYILGTGKEPSRGNCDLIAGTGDSAILKIPALVERVTFK